VTNLKRKAGKINSGLRSQKGVSAGIARGEQAIENGQIVSHSEAQKRMKRWLK